MVTLGKCEPRESCERARGAARREGGEGPDVAHENVVKRVKRKACGHVSV